jgi:hypothetical protein
VSQRAVNSELYASIIEAILRRVCYCVVIVNNLLLGLGFDLSSCCCVCDDGKFVFGVLADVFY